MDIVEFLKQRIAEDEETARAVQPLGHNYDMGGKRQDEHFTHGRMGYASTDGRARSLPDGGEKAHFGRHDPARVLAECHAKRAIVAMHKPTTLEDLWGAARADLAKRLVCDYDSSPDSHLGDTAEWPCATLRHLAAVYADHSAYDPAWRVE